MKNKKARDKRLYLRKQIWAFISLNIGSLARSKDSYLEKALLPLLPCYQF